MLHVRIFNRRCDSESHGAYQQWNNCFKRHCKADNPKFYLHVFCLLYGLDASLDLPLMLLASKLLQCKRSLPLPFLPPAVWLFEAVLCFQSAHLNVSLHITQAFRFFQLCSNKIYETVVGVVVKMFIDSVKTCCYLHCTFQITSLQECLQ